MAAVISPARKICATPPQSSTDTESVAYVFGMCYIHRTHSIISDQLTVPASGRERFPYVAMTTTTMLTLERCTEATVSSRAWRPCTMMAGLMVAVALAVGPPVCHAQELYGEWIDEIRHGGAIGMHSVYAA